VGVEIENVLRDPDHAQFGVVCHPKAMQNLTTLASAIPEILLGF